MFSLARKSLYRTLCRKFSSEGKKLVDVIVDSETGIASVVLQKPPVNSLDLDLLTELSDALSDVEKKNCKGLILKSSLDIVFSAGLDFKELHKPKPERMKKFWTTLQDVWIKLYGHSVPTVACMHGVTPAGACILGLGCEYRILVKNGSIGLNETLMGYSPPPWFIEAMEDVIGRRRSEIALTTGKMFTTEEAFQVGLIDEIAEDKDDAFKKGVGFCQLFKNIAPAARANTKRMIRKSRLEAFINNREQDFKECCEDAASEVSVEGLESYIDSLKNRKIIS